MPLPVTVFQEYGEDFSELGTVAEGSATLGREPENSLVVDSSKVSRRHGCLIAAGSQWLYRDLGSTNGSWLNGVVIEADGFKLLRDGDLLQLADARLQVSLPPIENVDDIVSSLVVLTNDEVFDEFLPGEGESFVLGGDDSAVPATESGIDEPILEITYSNDRFELRTGEGTGVLVNGIVAQGTTALADRDEVIAGYCRIMINNRRTQSASSGRVSSATIVRPEASTTGSILRREMRDDWESTASRRKFSSGKKFVFGSDIEENDSGEEPDSHTPQQRRSFEMSISQRVPTVGIDDEDPSSKRFGRIVGALGLILGVLVIGLLLFIVLVVV